MCCFHFYQAIIKKFSRNDYFPIRNVEQEEMGNYFYFFGSTKDPRNIIKTDIFILAELPTKESFN